VSGSRLVLKIPGMSARLRHRGFTIVELMITVTLIAILAMLVRAEVQRVNTRARASAYWNDCRVFSEAFNRYAQDRGSFPADQTVTGQLPPNMSDYLPQTSWLRTTPLGGRYEWDNKDANNSLGVTFNAAIKVTSCTWTTTNLQKIDTWFDDGNLTTGNFRVTDAGATVIFVIENASAAASAPSR